MKHFKDNLLVVLFSLLFIPVAGHVYATDWAMKVDSNGNVGIGTESPANKLEVNGNIGWGTHGSVLATDQGGNIELRGDSMTPYIDFSDDKTSDYKMRLVLQNGSLYITGTENLQIDAGGDFYIDHHHVIGGRFTVLDNGNVGIGTANPTRGKLDVRGAALYDAPSFAFYARRDSGPYIGMSGMGIYVGVYTDQRMVASEFDAISDERTKNIQGVSDSKADLSTLLDIEVTDFTHRDPMKGHSPKKKIIAQQVAKVFPQAVNNNHIEVVPDIMQKAKINQGEIQLAGHGLKKQDRVRLIFDNDSSDIYEVLSASKDSFRVSRDHDGEVFVYGREVNDFHTVDVAALSTLNISATQEMHKQMLVMKKEIEDLRAQIKVLQANK